MNIDRLITTLGAVLIQQMAYARDLQAAVSEAYRQERPGCAEALLVSLDHADRAENQTRALLKLASEHQTHKTQATRENLRSALMAGGEQWAEAAREIE